MRSILTIAILLALTSCATYSDTNNPPPIPQEEQPEVLTRGPVHEAFAQPVELENQSGVVAPNEPPADIVENPPDEKPAGKQFVWVPGYWAWDADREGYIWISGCWRAAPPGSYWVPGYWTQTASGWEWIAGFWASTPENQIQYLPAPPAIENIEATTSAPLPDDIWVPPCWYWTNDRYTLRAGYWLEPFDDWVWVPSHYVWTPRGYVFIAGRWDYPLSRRGVLFAPYYIPRPLYLRPGFSLSLGAVVDLGLLELNLFTYPRYCHYYFGDYYDPFYISLGIYPQFEWRTFHTWYDPLYIHSRWRHHETAQAWYDQRRHDYELRLNDRALRPPRTYRDMRRRLLTTPQSQRRDISVVRGLDHTISNSNEPFKFEKINPQSRERYFGKATDLRQFRDQRRQWEHRNIIPGPIEPLGHNRTGVEPQREIPQAPMENRRAESSAGRERGRLPSMLPRTESRLHENRRSNLNHPEQIHIPSAPIRGIRNHRGIFGRSVTPSRPHEENRIQSRSSHRSSERSRRR